MPILTRMASGATTLAGARRRRLLVTALATLLSLTLAAGGLFEAPAAGAYPTSSISVSGHGWGHGRGMGQWGALGYAVDRGWSYSQILDHYYGGTSAGWLSAESSDSGQIDVRLKNAVVDSTLTVTASKDFFVTTDAGSITVAAGSFARIAPNGGGWTVSTSTQCGGWASPSLAGSGGEVTAWWGWRTADTVDELVNVVRCSADGSLADKRAYRGTVRAGQNGGTIVTNRVSMGDYLRGAVPRESPSYWGDLGGGRGMNALKAQAVAARSYARAYTAGGGAICDTTSCQVYGGAGHNGELLEDARANRAVDETAHEVRLRNGAVASTEYSSSTGGWTAGGAFPAVEDAGDTVAGNSNHDWSTTIEVSSIEAAYPSIGSLVGITVSARNGLGADGGRATQVTISGTRANTTVRATSFQYAFGLKSDWYSFSAQSPVVGVATRSTGGWWTVTASGRVSAQGGAPDFGSITVALNQPVVGMAATPSGNGYWLVAGDGGIFSYGDAAFYGSTGSIRLNQPVVGMAATATGRGYWMVASDGGIFAYGDATFLGSMGATPLYRPVVGMASTPSGNGYWMVAADGGIFSFGDAGFLGSTGGTNLNAPVVGMARTASGDGYWFVAADGGIFAYGAPFYGSKGGQVLSASIAGMAVTGGSTGYVLVAANGTVYAYPS